MGRARRVDAAGMIYHVLNRANSRSRLYRGTAHDKDFLGVVEESLNFVPMRTPAYCARKRVLTRLLHVLGRG